MKKIKLSEIIRRAGFSKGKKRMIMNVDLSNVDCENDMSAIVDYVNAFTNKLPKNSIFGVIDLREIPCTENIIDQINRLSSIIQKHFFACALVSNEETDRISEDIKSKIKTYNCRVYKEIDPAVSWLNEI